MRNLRLIRESKGLSRSIVSKETGVSADSIWKFETGRTGMLKPQLKKLAAYFNVPIEELSKEIKEEIKECKSKSCLNQRCPLNNKCFCQSDQVVAGAFCQSENKTSDPAKAVKFNSTQALFIN